MATYGKIGELKESEESWTQYIERLEQYFLANDVEDAGKKRYSPRPSEIVERFKFHSRNCREDEGDAT